MMEMDLPVIDRTVHKTRLWLDGVMAGLETTNRARAFRALRAVLHALRDLLPVDEAAHLAAQMPMLIRGAFYEGWKPGSRPPRCRRRVEFLRRVAADYGDYPSVELTAVCQVVYGVLCTNVSRGAIETLSGCLPWEVRQLLFGGTPVEPSASLEGERHHAGR